VKFSFIPNTDCMWRRWF